VPRRYSPARELLRLRTSSLLSSLTHFFSTPVFFDPLAPFRLPSGQAARSVSLCSALFARLFAFSPRCLFAALFSRPASRLRAKDLPAAVPLGPAPSPDSQNLEAQVTCDPPTKLLLLFPSSSPSFYLVGLPPGGADKLFQPSDTYPRPPDLSPSRASKPPPR